MLSYKLLKSNKYGEKYDEIYKYPQNCRKFLYAQILSNNGEFIMI
jgi:hypothetical protein